MGGKRITPTLESDRDKIISTYEGGTSIDALASQRGCSNTPIRKLLIRHGVELRPPVRPTVLAKQKDAVIRLYRRGASTREIAKQFGVDRNTVSEFLRRSKTRRRVGLSRRTFSIETESDKGMLAGLLLGEGSIIIHGGEGRGVFVRIVNTDAAILGWLARFGGRIHWNKARKRGWMPCGVWDLARAVDVYHCLTSIKHLLVGKKKALASVGLKVLKKNYGLSETPAP